MRRFLLSFLSFSISLCCLAQDTLYLHDGWMLRQAGKDLVLPATVPGVVHQDLLRQKQIPDPFYRTNEDSVQWVGEEEWTYELRFTVPGFEADALYYLNFDGLDTYAEVMLNGKTIHFNENMFTPVQLKVELKPGENELMVHFFPPSAMHADDLKGRPYHLTAANDTGKEKYSVYTRKAPYQFGWDFSMRLLTQGIWRPVYLTKISREERLQARIEQVEEWQTLRINPMEAELSAQFYLVQLNKDSIYTVRIREKGKNQLFYETELDGFASIEIHQAEFRIPNPRLWWPHTMGEPHLYDFEVELWEGANLMDQKTVRTGIRTVELIQDKEPAGQSFYFKINGQPLFAKGANYVPMDVIPSRVPLERKKYLLEAAKGVNMNMIRVWGGGLYEEDGFYELCDEMGLLVWQDFLFACSMYPLNGDFLKNVTEEATAQLQRLKFHPSIAIWCGNNEVDVAWKNWGWQKTHNIHGRDSVQMRREYEGFFEKILPELVAEHHPGMPYTPTSPLSNWGKAEHFNYNSMHYWGVWHGPDGFEGYEKYVGRFMTEYGFQSYPDFQTVQTFSDQKTDLSLDSEVMRHHQKSYIGNALIDTFLQRYYQPAHSFPDFCYKSQLTQREGYRRAIRAHREQQPHCMGTLYWQLNDPWPGPSWSTIDYFGRWKAAHYAMQELYADLLLIPKSEEDQLAIGVSSHLPENLEATLLVAVHDFYGNKIHQIEQDLILVSNSYTAAAALAHSTLLQGKDSHGVYLDIQLKQGEEMLVQTYHFLHPPKDLALPVPTFFVALDRERGVLKIHSDTFMKDVYLSAKSVHHFEKNYFDLPAHTELEIPYRGFLGDARQVRLLHSNQR